MSLKNFFIKEDPIFGLEIGDTVIKLGLITPDKQAKAGFNLWLAEEPLAPQVIIGGIIKDEKKFLASLNKLVSQAPERVNYVIVSIEANNVYAHRFPIPKTIRDERLNDTVQMALDFKLPIRIEEAYLDWEKIPGTTNSTENEIHLQLVRRSIVNQYVRLLTQAGLKAIAVEARPVSLARTLVGSNEPVLIVDQSNQWVHLTIVKNQSAQTKHSFGIGGEVKPEIILTKIKGFIDYYEATDQSVKKSILLNQARGNKIFNQLLINELTLNIVEPTPGPLWKNQKIIQQDPARWITVAGVTERTLIPRSQDTLISLLPVGTEQAYTYHKISSFSKLVANLIISVTITIGLALTGTWLFLNKIGQEMTLSTQVLSSASLGGNYAGLEKEVREFNQLFSQTAIIIKDLPRWQTVLQGLTQDIPSDIRLNRLNVTALDKPITLSGVANRRANLAEIRNWLEANGLFHNISIPLANLEQTENIPFTASLNVKNPKQFLTN